MYNDVYVFCYYFAEVVRYYITMAEKALPLWESLFLWIFLTDL